MKLENLIHMLIGIVCIGFLPNAQPVAAQSRRVNSAPLGFSGGVHEAWVDRYDGPDNYIDEAAAVAVDGSGNVYVTGFSFDTNTDYDYTTIKYNSAGQRQWIARYDGTGSYIDKATAIAVGSSGNVYVTGASTSGNGGLDYATIKYNSAGQQQWVAYYDGPGDLDDVATAIVVDGSGNVYVTGESEGDYTTIKYNSVGQQQWVRRYDGPANSDDQVAAMAIDATGNVYVTGKSYSWESYYDYAAIKYNASGQQQWVARYDGPASSDDQGRAIAIDGAGNAYVTGYSDGSVYYDYATIKYNAAGQQQWARRYDGPAHDYDVANAISVDGSGSVYVTGGSYGSGFGLDYATIKYNSVGQQQWVRRYDGPANSDDQGTAMAADSAGSIYVTGRSYGSGFSLDYATVKYDAAGQQQWVAYYDGPTNSDDQVAAMAIDATGNVYVTGKSYDSGSDNDYATIKYVQDATPTPTPTATPSGTPRPSPTPRQVSPKPRPTPAPRP